MNFLRLLILPVVLFFFASPGLYFAPVCTAQKERSAHTKKPAQFHYVCPMHETVTSKSAGACPKCKMKLVRKPLPRKPDQ